MTEARPRRRVCILGATSAMAEETARLLAARGDALALVARNPARLEAVAADLRARGAAVATAPSPDLGAPFDPDALLAWADGALGGLDTVLIFQGVLGEQDRAASDPAALRTIVDVNATGAIALLTAAAARLERSDHPRPVVLALGSVAGDRGRASNFAYGASKAALAVAVQGVAHRFGLAGSRARAVVVKAGLTDTPMTAGMTKGGPLWSSPGRVAATVVRALDRGGPVVYAPGFWRWIMLVIRLLPQPLVNRLNL